MADEKNSNPDEREHVLPEQIRFTKADIEAMTAELIAEAPTEAEAFQRYLWDSEYAQKVEFLSWLRPNDDEPKNVTIKVPAGELRVSSEAPRIVRWGPPNQPLAEPPIEWPEGEFPPQEARSEENDDTVVDDFDQPSDQADRIEAEVVDDEVEHVVPKGKLAREYYRLLSAKNEALRTKQRQLNQLGRIERFLSTWVSIRITNEEIGDLREELFASRRALDPWYVFRRGAYVAWNGFVYEVKALVGRLFRRTG